MSQTGSIPSSMATTNDRDIKPENLIDHRGVETGSEKPAPLPWNPPGYQPPVRAAVSRRPRRAR